MHTMDRSELAHWLRLAGTPGVGNDTARRLLTAFGTPEGVFAQDTLALRQVASASQVHQLLQPLPELDAQLQDTWLWLHGAPDAAVARRVIVLGDTAYPASLLRMEDPPLLLYAMGCLPAWQDFIADPDTQPGLAIVGSRRPTPQGLIHARRFGTQCAAAGWTVVSGLALGIDGAAHEGALQGAAGRPGQLATVAVVGTGLDRVYPKTHLALAHAIAAQGMLLSEYPLGTPPLAANFPRRNRLIAGLTRGTLVVEAALRSGSLITARMAAEQGKDVFAVPGSIHALQSRGCHALIKQGAKLVESLDEVLEEFTGPIRRTPAAALAAAPPEQSDDLLQHLGADPIGLDALVARTGLDTARLQARLLALELEGQIARLPGALFQRLVIG